jgi:hypothetical protein
MVYFSASLRGVLAPVAVDVCSTQFMRAGQGSAANAAISGKQGKTGNLKSAKLPNARFQPRLYRQTESPVLVAIPGASRNVLLGSQRLSSSKGHTRREAATQSYGPRSIPRSPGCRRAGQVNNPSVPEPETRHGMKRRPVRRSEDWQHQLRSGLLCFFNRFFHFLQIPR